VHLIGYLKRRNNKAVCLFIAVSQRLLGRPWKLSKSSFRTLCGLAVTFWLRIHGVLVDLWKEVLWTYF